MPYKHCKKGLLLTLLAILLVGVAVPVIHAADDAATLYRQGVELAKKGKYEQALPKLESATSQDPANAEYQNYLGLVYTNLGRYHDAFRASTRALQLKPGHTEALENLVAACETLEDWRGMIEPLETLSRAQPQKAIYHAKLGRAYFQLGNDAKAINALTQAVTWNPHDEASMYKLGEIHLRQGHYEKAVDYLERAVSGFPFPYQRYYNLGLAYAHLKQFDKALQNFNKCVEEQPGFAPAYYNMGAVYQNTGRHQEAIEMYNQALEKNPALAEARNNLNALNKT
ncbi:MULTISPECIES: tetratricopeptide repeat protein [unclassified Nitrospina]|uniref:tetratricopeptide repeat protein n=1 Tax=unclassified Nitrospina TaxID=2638683 RepID=UPI003F972238